MRIILVLAGLLAVTGAESKVKLPALVSDNMVLQQQADVKLWGWAKPGATVNIETSWDRHKYQARAAKDSQWMVVVRTAKAGGPYTITLSDGEVTTLKDILLGEVWICGGQSNMEMSLRGNSSPILNASEIILHADNPSLRLFRVKNSSSPTPVNDVQGRWLESNSETARDFSAIGFQFGQILQEKLHVPVGMIMSTVGGTMVEAWMSTESLRAFPEVPVSNRMDTAKQPWKLPTALFNSMVAPLTNYAIKGCIWFQGESNRHEPALYGKLFPVMVADWRARWNEGDFPFYFVQIAPFGSTDKTRSGPLLREAQLNAASVIPNSGMASAMDVGVENDIHFFDKTKLSQRLAYWALGKTYGIKGINYQGPVLKSVKIEGDKAVLTFDNAPYLTSYRKPLTLFEIASADKVFHPAKAEILMNTVTVKSDEVKAPVAVRYAFKEFVVGELFNLDGLPASSFRTDNWNEVR